MSLLDKPNALIFKLQRFVVIMQIAQFMTLSIILKRLHNNFVYYDNYGMFGMTYDNQFLNIF